jgi:hypothetical protein
MRFTVRVFGRKTLTAALQRQRLEFFESAEVISRLFVAALSAPVLAVLHVRK